MFSCIHTCLHLVRRDMRIFWPTLFDGFINSVIWLSLNLVVFKYIFPVMGMGKGYAAFMVAANVMSWGLFEIFGQVSRIAADLTGAQFIKYDLTLPLPQWMVFLRIALSNGLQCMVMGALILPLSKLFAWSDVNLVAISYPKFFAILILGSLLYGFLSLWVASMMEDMHALRNIWTRFLYPLWWLGGYQFDWKTLCKVSPLLGRLSLVNPLLYCFEGVRGAMLGQEGFINFWYCAGALILFCAFFGYVGIKRMMRRLDCL